jgi:RNA polymerase sigma factor (sigma-70 family)
MNTSEFNSKYPSEIAIEKPSNCSFEVSDFELWRQFRNGSETAFIKIYNENFTTLLNYGYQITGKQELAEDCLQDIFIYLRQKRNTLGATDCIRFYLMKCMKRKLLKELKKSSNSFYQVGDEPFNITFSHEDFLIDQQIEHEKSEKLNQALKLLKGKKREALFYFYFQNLNYSQIADLMGLTHVKSARNLVYKALTILKSAMD